MTNMITTLRVGSLEVTNNTVTCNTKQWGTFQVVPETSTRMGHIYMKIYDLS